MMSFAFHFHLLQWWSITPFYFCHTILERRPLLSTYCCWYFAQYDYSRRVPRIRFPMLWKTKVERQSNECSISIQTQRTDVNDQCHSSKETWLDWKRRLPQERLNIWSVIVWNARLGSLKWVDRRRHCGQNSHMTSSKRQSPMNFSFKKQEFNPQILNNCKRTADTDALKMYL